MESYWIMHCTVINSLCTCVVYVQMFGKKNLICQRLSKKPLNYVDPDGIISCIIYYTVISYTWHVFMYVQMCGKIKVVH